MAHPHEIEALTNAFSGGLGVDENLLISVLGKAHPEDRKSFRKRNPQLFIEDERSFERCHDHSILLLKHEFSRFEYASVMWAMHPWERDARLIYEALKEGPHSYRVIVEVACTRSSEELLGARKAYHSLLDQSIEEELADHISGSERKLLVALVSAYRYEGPKVRDEQAISEAKILANAIKNCYSKNPIEDEEVIRILATRSKPHLRSIYKHYKDMCGKSIIEDLEGADLILKETIECLCTPHVYFSKALDEAMQRQADSHTKNALTRVIVTQAEADLKEIREQYQSLYGVSLSKKVEDVAKGNYKDFLLALIAKQN